MNNDIMNDLEISPPSVIRQAARDFAHALAETTQFKAFERASDQLHHDLVAQQAMQAYQEKQQSLRPLLMLNALSPDQQEELQKLHQAFTSQPVVQEYLLAQSDLAALCQHLGDLLSDSIGLNYAASCGVSCCG